MKHTKVKDLLNSTTILQEVNAKGWVRTFRNNQFIALNDGSTINNIQCVVDFENTPEDILKRITTGASVSVTGSLVESKGAGQKYEIQVAKLEILGDSDAEKFPMQPKKHSLEFLRENAHLRGVFAFETSDRFPVDKAIKENVDFYKENNSPFTKGLFGLHASMSLSEDTLIKVKKALGDMPIHIHVAESVLDEKDCRIKYQESILKRLERHGLLNPKSIIAHGIYIDDEELKIIKKHDCVIAVNFSSNLNNSVGVPPLRKFRELGIPVIIGNDGISSAMTTEYLSLYYATHLIDQTPNLFGLDELKKMIHDSYDFVNHTLGIKIGKIEKGYEADLLMVPYLAPTPMNRDNALGHLFFGLFHSFKPKDVYVQGRQVVKDYQIENKLENQYKEASKYAQLLWDRINKEVKE